MIVLIVHVRIYMNRQIRKKSKKKNCSCQRVLSKLNIYNVVNLNIVLLHLLQACSSLESVGCFMHFKTLEISMRQRRKFIWHSLFYFLGS